MPIIDIVVLVMLFLGFLLGWRLKAITLTGVLLSIVAGLWAANHFCLPLAGRFQAAPSAWGQAVAWMILFFMVAFSGVLAMKGLGHLLAKARMEWLDHLAGAAIITAASLVLIAIGLLLADRVAAVFHVQLLENSVLAAKLAQLLAIK